MASSLVQPLAAVAAEFPPGNRAYRRLLKRKQVLERTGLSNTVMYELIAQDRFPKPVKPTGGRASAWIEDEVDTFIASCIAARDSKQATA
ncbi:AlpA family transcriptional regulator [Burkholderia contaminans]|uniref:AlpA family transcriptional regulator n=1 Tax=Burkholderia contaminans TaxID=488447 RepID=A0A3N8PB28_9BURK|nr:AlpA family transcriptional regulator [Burkholderia contaminans]ELK6464714.1 AlpA family transcriptional regulator [Burkholderia contaminans]RQT08448.1 AlpA family transcriptional regulator [Burkholderia contaminans]